MLSVTIPTLPERDEVSKMKSKPLSWPSIASCRFQVPFHFDRIAVRQLSLVIRANQAS